MVRFNSSKKPVKPKKTIRKLAQPASVKPNKPKMVFEKCFLRGRYLIATSFIFLGLGALVARAAYVQSVNSETLSGEADKRSLRKDDVLSVRGSILDRNGQLLSVSVPMSAIVAEPRLMLKENALDDKERIKALANELNMTPAELVKKIEKNAKSGFLYLARQVEASKANYIRELKIKGISLETEPRRFYPRVEEAAQLIGFTNIDGKGIEGVEASFNSMLVGKDGARVVRKDKRGNVVEHIADEKKYDAQDVTLSIDEKLQSMVYREIKKAVTENKAESGTAVLVDVRTGEVLAMATAPSYNPNNLANVKDELKRNRAITDTFEPGSTVKPFVVLTALQRGAVRRDEVINTGSNEAYKVNNIYDIAGNVSEYVEKEYYGKDGNSVYRGANYSSTALSANIRGNTDNIVSDTIGTRQMILIGKCSTAENTSSAEIRDTDTAGEM